VQIGASSRIPCPVFRPQFPVTDKSGKRKVVKFRKACDDEWHTLSQAWAIALVNSARSPLAIAYFEKIRPCCHNRHHAYRYVANHWLATA
jgi:hypothetical protein